MIALNYAYAPRVLPPTSKLSACGEKALFIGLSLFITFYFRFFARFWTKNCGFGFDGSVFLTNSERHGTLDSATTF